METGGTASRPGRSERLAWWDAPGRAGGRSDTCYLWEGKTRAVTACSLEGCHQTAMKRSTLFTPDSSERHFPAQSGSPAFSSFLLLTNHHGSTSTCNLIRSFNKQLAGRVASANNKRPERNNKNHKPSSLFMQFLKTFI